MAGRYRSRIRIAGIEKGQAPQLALNYRPLTQHFPKQKQHPGEKPQTEKGQAPQLAPRVQALNPALSKPSTEETAARREIPNRLYTLGCLDIAQCEKDSKYFRDLG